MNEGQLIRKMTGKGWALVKRKLQCPQCEKAHRLKTSELRGRLEDALPPSFPTLLTVHEVPTPALAQAMVPPTASTPLPVSSPLPPPPSPVPVPCLRARA